MALLAFSVNRGENQVQSQNVNVQPVYVDLSHRDQVVPARILGPVILKIIL